MFPFKLSCMNKQSCSVDASNTVFGDPCENTFKYLEVEYLCLPGSIFLFLYDRT